MVRTTGLVRQQSSQRIIFSDRHAYRVALLLASKSCCYLQALSYVPFLSVPAFSLFHLATYVCIQRFNHVKIVIYCIMNLSRLSQYLLHYIYVIILLLSGVIYWPDL